MRYSRPSAKVILLIALAAAKLESAASSKMVVLRTDVDYCIGLDKKGRNNRRRLMQGRRLELVKCDTGDQNQQWDFDGSKWKFNRWNSLCVEMYEQSEGEHLRLKNCENKSKQKYDKRDKGRDDDGDSDEDYFQVTAESDNNLCVSFLGNPSSGRVVLLDECQDKDDSNVNDYIDNMMWYTVDPSDYNDLSDHSNDSKERSTDSESLIVLDQSDDFCIGATGSGVNSVLELVHCNPDDNNQLWIIEDGEWYLVNNDERCVEHETNGFLYLQTCSNSNRNAWKFNTKQIIAKDNNDCVTFSNNNVGPSIDDVLELEFCSNNNGEDWTFYDPNTYRIEVQDARSAIVESNIVNVEDGSKCIGVSVVADDAPLKLVSCSLDDARQLWETNDVDQLRLKEHQNYCLTVDSINQNEQPYITECGTNQRMKWLFDEGYYDGEINPLMTADLCLEMPSSGSNIVLRPCDGSDSQSWELE